MTGKHIVRQLEDGEWVTNGDTGFYVEGVYQIDKFIRGLLGYRCAASIDGDVLSLENGESFDLRKLLKSISGWDGGIINTSDRPS